MPTVDGRGPPKWDDFPLFDGPAGDVSLTVDGYTIRGAIAPWSIGWSTPGSRILMGDGTTCHQLTLPRPKQPITMEPRSGSFDLTVAYQDDFIRLRRASCWSAVLAFMGEPHEDEWSIPNAEAGQTEWRTSRRVHWNGTTYTHVTHPPYAAILSSGTWTSQTVVTSAPGAGEVRVPTTQTSGQYYASITTPANIEGERLLVRYWPEMLVSVTVGNAYSDAGLYVLSVELQEGLAGDYE